MFHLFWLLPSPETTQLVQRLLVSGCTKGWLLQGRQRREPQGAYGVQSHHIWTRRAEPRAGDKVHGQSQARRGMKRVQGLPGGPVRTKWTWSRGKAGPEDPGLSSSPAQGWGSQTKLLRALVLSCFLQPQSAREGWTHLQEQTDNVPETWYQGWFLFTHPTVPTGTYRVTDLCKHFSPHGNIHRITEI